jgi:DNA-binding MarR family transcriptional regulator
LKPLERRGLLKVLPGSSDRRARVLKLTDKGRELLASAVPVWQSTHDEVESLMLPGAPDDIRRSLQSLS